MRRAKFPVQSITNQRTPLLVWLKSLPASYQIGLESTGCYHECWLTWHIHGYTVFLLNPLDTRRYTKAMGNRTKTDRVDAELIARLIGHYLFYMSLLFKKFVSN